MRINIKKNGHQKPDYLFHLYINTGMENSFARVSTRTKGFV